MQKIMLLCVSVILLALVFSNAALAQKGVMWRGGGGWGAGSPYVRMYNPQTVETINGEVLSVDQINLMDDMLYGIHLVVKTDQETIEVHLGPGWYIENQEVKIEPKDMVEVKGSQIIYQGKPALIAAEVKKGDEVLTLREANGFPVWSGWRRR